MRRAIVTAATALAVLSAVGLAAAPAIPKIAPAAMTMGVMSERLGVEKYEDAGRCDFWVLNMTNPTDRIERQFPCGFFWDWSEARDGYAYVHEALVDHDSGGVFRVPGMERGNLEEWYRVDGHMLTPTALRFALDAEADAGVLMPPPGARGALVMGWVESGGARDAEERLVHPRELVEAGEENVSGVPTVRWESSFSRVRTSWHGYDVLLTEDVTLWSDPRTAWILKMERHVLVEMTPSQMAAVQGFDVPPAVAGATDGDVRAIMELTYVTSPDAVAAHEEETRFFQTLVTPIERWSDIARGSGAALALFAGTALLARTIPPRGGREDAGAR